MSKFLSIAGACLLLFVASCATAVSGAWQADPSVAMTPQAVMSGKTCSDLPLDKTGTPNPVGWAVKTAPAGMAPVMSCGSRYASGAFFCQDPSKCGELVWTTNFGEADRGKKVHGIVDLVGNAAGATITACAEPTERFAVAGHLDCKPVALTFNGTGARGVFEATVPTLITGPGLGSEQTAPVMMISIKAAGSVPITIGQVGWAEAPTGQ